MTRLLRASQLKPGMTLQLTSEQRNNAFNNRDVPARVELTNVDTWNVVPMGNQGAYLSAVTLLRWNDGGGNNCISCEPRTKFTVVS